MKEIRDTTTTGSARAMDQRTALEAERWHRRARRIVALMKEERIPPRESEKNSDTIRMTAAKSASDPLLKRPWPSPCLSRNRVPQPPAAAGREGESDRRLGSTSQKTRLNATGITIST